MRVCVLATAQNHMTRIRLNVRISLSFCNILCCLRGIWKIARRRRVLQGRERESISCNLYNIQLIYGC